MRALTWLALGALFAGCSVIGEIGAAPHPSRVGPPPADLGAADVSVPTPVGAPLAGWWLDAPDGAPSVVVLHGVTDSRLGMVRRARLLHAAGYGVLLVDLPGHGETPAEAHHDNPAGGIGFGWPERHAAAAAVGWTKRRRPHTRVGVIGVSLGGAAAVLAGPALNADALVLESVYPSLRAAVGNRVRRLGPLAPLARRTVLSQVRSRLGVPPDSLRPVATIARIQAPVLVLGGSADRSTPPAETRALFGAAPNGYAVWIVDGAGHQDLEQAAPHAYRRRVLAFLDATLR